MLLDLAVLQTLVAAVDLDGFGRAARKLHRSPAAVSLQLKMLEERVGLPLFRKVGRRQALTDAGDLLLNFARRLLQLNDDALLALRGIDLNGEVRFGMPQDFADHWLPQTLAQFARAHPAVRIDIKVDRSAALRTQLNSGALDLIIAFGETAVAGNRPLARLPVHWLAHKDFELAHGQPLPLLLLDQPCGFRQAAIAALDKAGLPWRLALSSGSVSAIWAAAAAGLGITARSTLQMPDGLVDIGRSLRLPKLAKIALQLEQHAASSSSATMQLRALVENVVRAQLV